MQSGKGIGAERRTGTPLMVPNLPGNLSIRSRVWRDWADVACDVGSLEKGRQRTNHTFRIRLRARSFMDSVPARGDGYEGWQARVGCDTGKRFIQKPGTKVSYEICGAELFADRRQRCDGAEP